MTSCTKNPTICIFSMIEYPFTKRVSVVREREFEFEPKVRTVVIECRTIALLMIMYNVQRRTRREFVTRCRRDQRTMDWPRPQSVLSSSTSSNSPTNLNCYVPVTMGYHPIERKKTATYPTF